jgi:organic radical activating enzyme
MEDFDLSKYAMKEIAGRGLPVYIFGTVEESILRLLSYFREYRIECETIFADKTGSIVKDRIDVLSLCAHLGIMVVPPPVDVSALPKGIVIYAGELIERRRWMEYFSRGGYHTVIDANDMFCYTARVKCDKYFANCDNLLLRCRTCVANSGYCPISDNYYRGRGLSRRKSINRLLIRCGFICNYKCDGCSQFIPYFTERHRRNFDGREIIADVKKVAASLQYIQDIWLEGGEAMLWKPFPDLLRSVAALENVGRIFVLTNGSYVPSENVLDALSDHRELIKVEINAYEANSNMPTLFDAFDKRGIAFMLRSEIRHWYDFRDTHFRNRSLAEIKDMKNKCSFFKRNYDQWMLTDGKLSAFCCEAGYLTHYLDKYDEFANDFIAIRQTDADSLSSAMERLYDRAYLDACNYCAGAFYDNTRLKAARQLSRNE